MIRSARLAFVVSSTLAATATAPARAHQPPIEDVPVQTESRPGEMSPEYLKRPVAAPKWASEFTLSAGYTQAFGTMHSGVGMPRVLVNGLNIELGTAYRMTPRWSFGFVAGYQQFAAERSLAARGLTAGMNATYHLRPYVGADPWLQLGTGYRMVWESPPNFAPMLLTHGLTPARALVGVDFRFTPNVALGPMVGADLNLFLWQSGGTATTIADPRVSTFIFAGAQGRFDFRGARVNP